MSRTAPLALGPLPGLPPAGTFRLDTAIEFMRIKTAKTGRKIQSWLALKFGLPLCPELPQGWPFIENGQS